MLLLILVLFLLVLLLLLLLLLLLCDLASTKCTACLLYLFGFCQHHLWIHCCSQFTKHNELLLRFGQHTIHLPTPFKTIPVLLKQLQVTAKCCLQVLDMLLSAGMSVSDPLLSTFFQVTCIDDAAFGFLENAVQPSNISRPSYQLLIKIVARTAAFASWADASSGVQEHLMMVAFDDKCELSRWDFAMRWDDLILRVKLPRAGAEGSSGQFCFCFCLVVHASRLWRPMICKLCIAIVHVCIDGLLPASHTMFAA